MIQRPLILGDKRQLFGFLTSPQTCSTEYGVLILNAGLLHHIGPFGLHVDLANKFATIGIPTIRLDQSGKGESPKRHGFSRSDSIIADYDDAHEALQQLGAKKIVLLGLCSGADDATLIASQRSSVGALVLLDGYARRNFRYYINYYKPRIWSFRRWRRFAKKLLQQVSPPFNDDLLSDTIPITISLREWPEDAEMIERYRNLLANGTRILSIFTAGQNYYNYANQLAEIISAPEGRKNLEEVYLAHADHTYSTCSNRKRLVEYVSNWLQNRLIRNSDLIP